MSVLDEIYANKRVEVLETQARIPLQAVRDFAEKSPFPPSFTAAIRRQAGQRPRLIAEVKKASPSRGLLVENFDHLLLASVYRENGASAISVLTDQRFFMGKLDYLREVAQANPGLPLLRKDFLFDAYQIYEARAAGASAVLLIAAMLKPAELIDLYALACELQLAVLIEVHNQAELESVLSISPEVIGVNNRNLHDLKVSLETTFQLRHLIPAHICMVAESGIHHRSDVDRLSDAGVDAILVGEALVTAADIAAKVRELAL